MADKLPPFTPILDCFSGVKYQRGTKIKKLNLSDKAVFGAVWRYAQQGTSKRLCNASPTTIAERLNIAPNTVRASLSNLCEARLLQDLTPDLNGKTHEYWITDYAQEILQSHLTKNWQGDNALEDATLPNSGKATLPNSEPTLPNSGNKESNKEKDLKDNNGATPATENSISVLATESYELKLFELFEKNGLNGKKYKRMFQNTKQKEKLTTAFNKLGQAKYKQAIDDCLTTKPEISLAGLINYVAKWKLKQKPEDYIVLY